MAKLAVIVFKVDSSPYTTDLTLRLFTALVTAMITALVTAFIATLLVTTWGGPRFPEILFKISCAEREEKFPEIYIVWEGSRAGS